jgi:phosphoribosylamine--glycine ligase
LVTDGGRVLGVTARGDDLPAALERAYEGADRVQFEGKTLRRDIGKKGLAHLDT